ncbi:magnesium transporter [Kocuria coralli]|uniref:Magnesium transporter MgtE n=1 Tax=Kocuria coralli TaxID=1461025 RepID=A0A5J5L195_9MICC|nr:magnesium transporter [Kocuria coralli]KAA9395613.1 magnesium transporter [Kocuria coralli]
MPTGALHQILDLVQERRLPELAELVRPMPTPQVVGLVESLPTPEAAVVFRLLGKDESTDVFDHLGSGAQADLVAEFGHGEIAGVFGSLDPEDKAWLLDEVPAKVAKRLVAAFDDREMEAVTALLGYSPGSVGRRIAAEAVRCTPGESAGGILEKIRGQGIGTELCCRIPVIASDRKLVGVVELTDLLQAAPDALIETLMDEHPGSAYTDDDAERVAHRQLDTGELILPVVDSERRLVGILPIADAARIDRSATAEDQARAGASEPLRRPYLLTSIRTIARARIIWLLVLAVSAALTVQVLELFEETLAQRVALALFIPLLIGIGGNTGAQAATTVTRAVAVGDVGTRDLWRVAFKELRAGILLGAILAILAFAITSLIYGMDIGTVIALTLLLNCPIAATVGGVIPLVARACSVDPAVFSTPFISTFCDATGLLVYFMVAISVLGL